MTERGIIMSGDKCTTCGIGLILPSLRCGHCDADFGSAALRVYQLLRNLEWSYKIAVTGAYYCPECRNVKSLGYHQPECELAAMIEELRPLGCEKVELPRSPRL